MLNLGDVLRGSVHGTTGYLSHPRDLQVLEAAIVHNLPILQAFGQVVVATNYGPVGREGLRSANARLWRRYLPEPVIIDSPHNRGHSIGTADLDNILFEYCKGTGSQWLCKGSNDVLLGDQVLQIPVQPAGFYYLNAVSYSALRDHAFDLSQFTSAFFYPQSTFYVIDVSQTDFLVDRDFLDRSWRIVNRIPGYNGRIWEHIPGWTCEHLLRQCVLRNELTTCHMMSEEQYRHLLQIVIDGRIEDCSYKGLAINGICHAQGLSDPSDAVVVMP